MEKVRKQWGYYEVIDKGRGWKLKKLFISKGKRTSYQYHNKRAEFWYIVEGIADIVYDDGGTFQASKFEEVVIPKKTKHQIINKQSRPLIMFEFWQGNSSEEDIVRIRR